MSKDPVTAVANDQGNIAATVAKLAKEFGGFEFITNPEDRGPHLISMPEGRRVEDVTAQHLAALEFFKPLRRTGTARLQELDSFTAWANRFKGDSSAIFAHADMREPTLTCIVDYHAEGAPAEGAEDATARRCKHRAVYPFPLSDEWKAWAGVSGRALDKDEMGEFIEAQARDIMDPTPGILAADPDAKGLADWEIRLINLARQIEGRYGQLGQLLAMSRRFQVHETSDLTVTTNRDTGEAQIQFLSEHKDADGAPLKVPNLVIIAIPVFRGGALYRMPVRFRYRKVGAAVKFTLSIYNPEKAFDAAFREAAQATAEATELPLFYGQPEG